MSEATGPDMTAAELALGLLDGPERAAALRRVLAEPGFAAEVQGWSDRFGALFAHAPEAEPDPALFDRIERSLDGRPAAPRRWLWPSLAGLSTAAAAVLLALLVTRPVPVAPPPAAVVLMTAAIAPTGEGEPVVAVYTPAAGQVRIAAADMADARHSAQLWIIGHDGVPHSLGLLRPGTATALPVTPATHARFATDAVLAVSVEPLGGSPTALPTGPVVAQGRLTQS